MRKLVTMREALLDPELLGCALPGESWFGWRTLLVAIAGEALDGSERAAFERLTGREREPGVMVDTFLAVAGRRSGKSRAMACLSVYASCLCDWSDCLALGERGQALFVAPSQAQAERVLRYAAALVDHAPLLRAMVTGRTSSTLSLSNGIDFEVQAASHRTARGGTAVSIVLDECAYLQTSDASLNSDVEIVTALRPSLATTHGPLLLTSSPAAMQGVVYRLWKRHYGPAGDRRTLVVQAATPELNPSIDRRVIDAAFEDDAVLAGAEYGAVFREPVTAHLSRSVVEAAVEAGVTGRLRLPGVLYHAFVDVAGGGGSDSFALAVGHKVRDGGRDVCLLDAVLEIRPPFSPDEATERAADLLAVWGVKHVTGDHYASSWPVAAFARHGIGYQHAPLTTSDVYVHVGPLFTSGRARLLDGQPRLIDQLCGLRRKAGNAGREIVTHASNGHDDVACAVAGLLWKLAPATKPVVIAGPMIFASGERVDMWGGGGGVGVSDRDARDMLSRGWLPEEVERLKRARQPWALM